MPHLIFTCSLALVAAQLAMADRLTAATGRLAILGRHSKRRGSEHWGGERCVGERGQATTEYALVLLAAALVALLVIAWASAGGGAARISQLFNRVIDAVISRV